MRIKRIILVDITPIARRVLGLLKSALPAKIRERFTLTSASALNERYVQASHLPSFLGGSAVERDSLAANLVHWESLLACRRKWEAQLVEAYGHGFAKLCV